MAWHANNESGFDLETAGENRRVPTDFDGLKLVKFFPKKQTKMMIFDNQIAHMPFIFRSVGFRP